MIKKLYNKFIVNLKRELNRNKIDSKIGLSLSQIRFLYALPKFKSASIKWFDKDFKFTDANSFLHTVIEIYEEEVYLFKTKNPKPLIIDLGSNIGLSILYFKKLYPNSEIIGFEPDPQIFKILESNLEQFQIKEFSLYNAAAWISDGELTFYSEGALSGSVNKIKESNEIKVKAIDIKKIIGERQVDFLKIDIEGAEYEILNHLKDSLKQVNLLFVEYHHITSKAQELHLLLDILDKSGFSYHIKQTSDSIKHPFISKSKTDWNFSFQLNIFAYR